MRVRALAWRTSEARSSGSRLRASIGFCACVLAGCADETQLVAPDLSALVRDYEQPTAEFDPAAAQRAITNALPWLSSLTTIDSMHFLLDSIDAAQAGFAVHGTDQELEAAIDGHATLRVICPGLDGTAPPDAERDGSIELTTIISDAAFEPVMFGRARACSLGQLPDGILPPWLPALPQQLRARLDGEIALHLGERLVLGRETTLRPLVSIAGTLNVEGVGELHDLDFRMPAPGVLEVRIQDSRGQAAIVVADQTSIAIRERRGMWVCSLDGGVSCLPSF